MDDGAGGTRLSTQAIADRVREAGARGTPLRIVGAGTWLDAGPPVALSQPLTLSGERGIVDYTPGDLTLTARAGTPLAEIARVTAAERQWLTLDPHGTDAGTIGATVSTASCGPLAHAFGTPRDLVLGLEAVTGDGTIIRTGGRVVKNVAGFDLTRLFTGSWGTLAVITEVTVRLRALPEVEETVGIAVRDDAPQPLSDLLGRLRAIRTAPLALELLSPAIAARLGAGASTVLLVRLGGNEESVRAQRSALEKIGTVVTLPERIWSSLRGSEAPNDQVVRISDSPFMLDNLWRIAREASAAHSGAYSHASVGRGIVRCVLPSVSAGIAAFRGFDEGAFFLKTVPERVSASNSEWPWKVHQRYAGPLASRARDAFDPHRILNRAAA